MLNLEGGEGGENKEGGEKLDRIYFQIVIIA